MNPLTLFFVVFAFYNLFGLVNTPWTSEGAYDKTLGWQLFLIGCFGFLLGSALTRKTTSRRPISVLQPRTSRQLTFVFLALFSTCVVTTIALSGGIPLLQGEERFGNSALMFNLAQLYGFWELVRTISDAEAGRRFRVFQPILYLTGALCFGYRTPILMFMLVLLLYFAVFRLAVRKALLICLSVGIFIVGFSAVFAAFRVSQNYDLVLFFKNIDFRFTRENPYLLPFVPAMAMFDFSQQTVATIGTSLHEFMYGELFLSNYETFLPGKHWGARNIIGDITGARWVAGRPMSITPTLQGALYVDFSYYGVFFGFFLLASGIKRLWRMALHWGPLGKFSFSYLLALSIMAVHNGYWDVGFVFFLLFLLVIRVFDALKARFNHQPA
ncbi:hypothetical protein [Caballeronia novacaledonica]|nr:hypothetical protein [Caballeronia novacaledonica]